MTDSNASIDTAYTEFCDVTVRYNENVSYTVNSISAVNREIQSGAKHLEFKAGSICTTAEPLLLNQDGLTIHQIGMANDNAKLIFDARNHRALSLQQAREYTKTNPSAFDSAIQVTANNVSIYDLRIEIVNNPYVTSLYDCPLQSIGGYQGIDIASHANYTTVQNTTIQGFYAGVRLFGSESKISDNTFIANNMMALHHEDSGAMGILVQGNANTIQDNSFRDNRACSEDYVHDGSSVEIFASTNGGASLNIIKGNKSIDDHHFIEFGARVSGANGNKILNNTYTANTPTDKGKAFLVTRGTRSDYTDFGVVGETVVRGNYITMTTGRESNGGKTFGGAAISCVGDCLGQSDIHLTNSSGKNIQNPCELIFANHITLTDNIGYLYVDASHPGYNLQCQN